MELFLSQIPILIIAGVVIGVLAVSSVFFADMSQAHRADKKKNCTGSCGSCENFNQCHKDEKQA